MATHQFEFFNPMRISKSRIIQIAESLSYSYVQLHGSTPKDFFSISFDHVYDTLIYPQYEIALEEGDSLGMDGEKKILGHYDVLAATISLDAALCDKSNSLSSKKAFTFWHELGHAFLHTEWLRTQIARFPDGRFITTDLSISPETTEKLERQANLFASHAAVPSWFLDFVLKSTFNLDHPIFYRGPNTYWLDVWGQRKLCEIGSFSELCRMIAYNIRNRFGGLSIESLTYRIESSPLLINVSHEKTMPPRLMRAASVEFDAALATA